jgi:hypothetical protein
MWIGEYAFNTTATIMERTICLKEHKLGDHFSLMMFIRGVQRK